MRYCCSLRVIQLCILGYIKLLHTVYTWRHSPAPSSAGALSQIEADRRNRAGGGITSSPEDDSSLKPNTIRSYISSAQCMRMDSTSVEGVVRVTTVMFFTSSVAFLKAVSASTKDSLNCLLSLVTSRVTAMDPLSAKRRAMGKMALHMDDPVTTHSMFFIDTLCLFSKIPSVGGGGGMIGIDTESSGALSLFLLTRVDVSGELVGDIPLTGDPGA